jgi:hypothetical protein
LKTGRIETPATTPISVNATAPKAASLKENPEDAITNSLLAAERGDLKSLADKSFNITSAQFNPKKRN